MKRLLSLFLGVALLLSACAPAAPQPAEPSSDSGLYAWEIALSILDACEKTADELERTDEQLDESTLSAYLTNYYGLEDGSWTDCAIYRAGGAEAFEIAVLQFREETDLDAAASGLAAYILSREGDFTGYAPEQAAIVHDSLVAQQGRFAALLICEDPAAAKAAFDAFFEDIVHPDAPAPSSPSPEPSPDAPPPSASPSEPPSPAPEEEPSQSPERVHPLDPPEEPSPEEPAQSPEQPPPVPEEPSPSPEQPSPQPEGPQSATYPGRYPYDPPNTDDMSIYDTSAIRAAWTSGDPSPLSDYDRAIYDRCREIFEQNITDGMSDYEKERALYRALVDMAEYDQSHYDPFAQMDRASYTPYGPLINGKGVCLGFASAFQLLMDLCGIECITVVGAAYFSSEDHAWNMVKLNDAWYCADPTWDLNSYRLGYFNVTSDFMADTNHQWDYNNVPEAVTTGGGKS